MSYSEKGNRISSKELFAEHIRRASKFNGISLLDAIVSYCEDTSLQIEDIIMMIDVNLKEELRVEVINDNRVVNVKKIAALF